MRTRRHLIMQTTTVTPSPSALILSWGGILAALTTATLGVLSAFWKTLCTGGPLLADGVTTLGLRAYGSRLCYSDLLVLWQYRGLADHAAPYVGDYVDGQITGGVIEYPVLGGFFLWLTGLPAQTDAVFILVTGLLLALAAVGVTVLLYGLTGPRAFLWAAAPAVLVYSAYNIDVLPALATVAALAVVAWPSGRWSPTVRALVAAAILGIGAGIKLYPLMFALPIALWAAVSASDGRLRIRWTRFLGVLAVGGGVFVAVNVPFAVASFEGWLASFQFQSVRRIDDNSLALWWWIPHLLGYDVADRTAQLTLVATGVTAAAFAAIAVYGLVVTRREGVYPWLQTSAALLVAFMLLNKVNSPQYIIWLLPFFVLLAVRVRWVLVYFVVDFAIFFGYFRPFLLASEGRPTLGLSVLLATAILLRAALLAYFAFAFLRAPAATRSPLPAASRLNPSEA